MHTVLIVAIVFGSIVACLAVICGTILITVKARRGGLSRKSRQIETDEIKMIQEIYEGLLKMEKRVESLETILLDSQGKDRES